MMLVRLTWTIFGVHGDMKYRMANKHGVRCDYHKSKESFHFNIISAYFQVNVASENKWLWKSLARNMINHREKEIMVDIPVKIIGCISTGILVAVWCLTGVACNGRKKEHLSETSKFTDNSMFIGQSWVLEINKQFQVQACI